MKVIVAGSRSITDYSLVSRIIDQLVAQYEMQIDEVVSGLANGVDRLGRKWAIEHGIPPKDFKAEWEDLSVPGALVKVNKWGKKYNALAGHMRNERMAQYGDALIAIWDGKSEGTSDMIHRAKAHKLEVYHRILPIGG